MVGLLTLAFGTVFATCYQALALSVGFMWVYRAAREQDHEINEPFRMTLEVKWNQLLKDFGIIGDSDWDEVRAEDERRGNVFPEFDLTVLKRNLVFVNARQKQYFATVIDAIEPIQAEVLLHDDIMASYLEIYVRQEARGLEIGLIPHDGRALIESQGRLAVADLPHVLFEPYFEDKGLGWGYRRFMKRRSNELTAAGMA